MSRMPARLSATCTKIQGFLDENTVLLSAQSAHFVLFLIPRVNSAWIYGMEHVLLKLVHTVEWLT
jgi:hypothetical protein